MNLEIFTFTLNFGEYKMKWIEFEIEDTFNNNNVIKGKISAKQSCYGLVHITEINEEKTHQVVQSAPKMGYPYNRNGVFFFDKEDFVAYEKYDGTAVIAYAYTCKGNVFVSYRTRLNPILGKFEIFDFQSMWKEMLGKHKNIPDFVSMNRTIVFELFGIRNKHLIFYDIPLDIKLLFGIDRSSGHIILPEEIDSGMSARRLIFNDGDNFKEKYENARIEIERSNKTISKDEIRGMEGSVLYIKNEFGNWVQWKCKPESVMKVHCKPGLSKKDIIATCYNALENVEIEALTFDFVKSLLLEEINEREVMSRKSLIHRCIDFVKEEVSRMAKIIEKYNSFGVKLSEDKRAVMRHMSQFFEKKGMGYVYAVIESMESKC